jgi:hypothetical protein
MDLKIDKDLSVVGTCVIDFSKDKTMAIHFLDYTMSEVTMHKLCCKKRQYVEGFGDITTDSRKVTYKDLKR